MRSVVVLATVIGEPNYGRQKQRNDYQRIKQRNGIAVNCQGRLTSASNSVQSMRRRAFDLASLFLCPYVKCRSIENVQQAASWTRCRWRS